MNFFLQTLSQILKAFLLIIKGNEKASDHLQIMQAHWLLSWLMVIAGSFLYLMFMPTIFMSDATQEIIGADTSYQAFKSANMTSLIVVLLTGYLIIYLLEKPLEYTGNVRRFIISQNWLFAINILLFLPLSVFTLSSEEGSPFISLFIFMFMFVLFFAYRCIKILLGVPGLKAFILLAILLFVEVTLDNAIDQWFGIIAIPETPEIS